MLLSRFFVRRSIAETFSDITTVPRCKDPLAYEALGTFYRNLLCIVMCSRNQDATESACVYLFLRVPSQQFIAPDRPGCHAEP